MREMDLPMRTRDGITLLADVYRPDAPGRFPVLVLRLPYGKDGREDPNGVTRYLARYGYVLVVQDCRGRFGSEGEYDPIFQETADGYDCVEWAARLPWSNGRVGTTGQSYHGQTQYAIACSNPMPPSLQVMAPVSASSNPHQGWIYHTGGVTMWCWMVPYAIEKGRNTLLRAGRQDLLQKLDEYVRPGDNYAQPLRDEWYRHVPISDWVGLLKDAAPYFGNHLEHPDDGDYWHRADVSRNAHAVTVPMLHVSSWYDIFGEGAPNAFSSIRQHAGSAQVRNSQRLIVGPWGHLLPYDVPSSTGTGDIDFGSEALIDLRRTLLDWYDYWLKDIDTGIMDGPPVTIFTMGVNQWQTLDDWPPPSAKYVRYFLHSGGNANTLHGDGVLNAVPPGSEPQDTFTFDPNDPVPTLGGNNLILSIGVMDQRSVEQRRDVLVFTSEVLDTPLQATGPIIAVLWASSSARDTDFTAKLVDVRPDGYAQNLADGIIRARYRNSTSNPTLLEPDVISQYSVDLWATSHVFLPGHRIRVEVSSSNFPRYDRNPNTGRTIATESKLIEAQQRIYHDAEHPSHIVLPLIPR